MSYDTGLSGLQAAANDLDVIGNNIANADTVGFKTGEAVFADMYANSLASSSANQIGIGVNMTTVENDFSTGTFTSNGNPYDVAINGNGFFVVSNNGSLAYTRDGQFQTNAQNVITTLSGQPLMGYPVGASGTSDASQMVPLSIAQYQNLPPQPTTSVGWSFNLDPADTPPTVTPFDPTNSSTYNYPTSVTVFDSNGSPHTLDIYFAATSTPGQWNAYLGSSDPTTTVSTGTGTGSSFTSLGPVTFNSAGVMTSPASSTFAVNMDTTNGSVSPQPITLNLAGTTGYGGVADAVTGIQPNGYPASTFSSISISPTGQVTANYSNTEYGSSGSQVIGQVALATFNDPNGLNNLGGNLYQQTSESGDAKINEPGSGGTGDLLDGDEEESNVDLTSQLVDLITAQRNYQANAQTIKTQQTIDQSILNL
ncbi:MAG: flagellar hook protein FlgE [Paraburkholderia sp.]|uniref:flagellar hook protein FlgE n=1 Tax=Paraburkholderia sp. TaxID=1926495 RepID=UPI003C376FB3